MTWTSTTEAQLRAMIVDAERQMSAPERKLWELIRIPPQKWKLSPWGDEIGGFWVVAILGGECLYYNEIEEGFNQSTYKSQGAIDKYWCSQDELQWLITRLHQNIVEP